MVKKGHDMLPTEEWLPVKGYEGLYLVSNIGRVRSLPRKYCKGRILRPIINSVGYPTVALSRNGNPKKFLIHRLVAFAFLEYVEEKDEVNHKDGIKTNNVLENLEWCTSSENTQHSYNTGLQKKKPMKKETKEKLKKANLIRYYFTPCGVYDTIKEASKGVGCNRKTLIRRCVSSKFKEYYYTDRLND